MNDPIELHILQVGNKRTKESLHQSTQNKFEVEYPMGQFTERLESLQRCGFISLSESYVYVLDRGRSWIPKLESLIGEDPDFAPDNEIEELYESAA